MRQILSIVVLLILTACSQDESCCSVTITITVPEGTGEVFLAGNRPELGPWSPSRYAMDGEGTERSSTLTMPRGTLLEYKFTLGSRAREAVDESLMRQGNFQLEVDGNQKVHHVIPAFRPDPKVYMEDWRESGVEGTLVYWTDVASEFLERTRHVVIWLPPGYDEDRDEGYPVLYMHDGQELFDPRISSGQGTWAIDKAIVRLVQSGEIPPVIVVGAWNSENRTIEYSPWHDAPDYARFLIEELMPRVDAEFNTATGPENTAVMGASMGGLLSYYLVTNHSRVFGSCGCMSSAFVLSEAAMHQMGSLPSDSPEPDETPFIVRDIEAGVGVPGTVRYWFDYGTVGGDVGYDEPHQQLRSWLLEQGLVEGEDFVIRVYEGADHSIPAWRERLGDPLKFLFGRASD